MSRLMLAVLAAIALSGCRYQGEQAVDPFWGRQTVPPPGTGAVGTTTVYPGYPPAGAVPQPGVVAPGAALPSTAPPYLLPAPMTSPGSSPAPITPSIPATPLPANGAADWRRGNDGGAASGQTSRGISAVLVATILVAAVGIFRWRHGPIHIVATGNGEHRFAVGRVWIAQQQVRNTAGWQFRAKLPRPGLDQPAARQFGPHRAWRFGNDFLSIRHVNWNGVVRAPAPLGAPSGSPGYLPPDGSMNYRGGQ